MGLFGQSTPFDADIEKATFEKNTNEDWALIMDVCDKISSNPRTAKDSLKAIMKRMGHADPHVVMQALTLLDACVKNCGKPFHLEIASREFENEFRRLHAKAQPKIAQRMREVLKKWAEGDFKSDPELNLIPSLYAKLRHEGFDFSNLAEKPNKTSAKLTAALKDPNVVSSQQEEDDIAKAIELSLKEGKNSPKHQQSSSNSSNSAAAGNANTNLAASYPSLYPSFAGSDSMASITSTGGASNNSTNSQPEPRKVRALYDFEAAEENELTFFAGEIIHVLDDSDPNWWKGYNKRGEGLFPSNFVTADLSVDPERLDVNQQNKTKKSVQFEDDAKALQLKTEAVAAAVAEERVEIDEAKIDRLLHLLHEANPEDPSQDSDEMLRLEQEVNQMGPLIDAELERVDRKHAQLTQLSSDLVDAINLYHSLMRDDRMGGGVGGGGQAAGGYGMSGGMLPPGAMAYPGSGMPNAQMLYGPAGYAATNFPLQHMRTPPTQMPAAQSYGMQSSSSLAYATTAATASGPGAGGYAGAGAIPLHYQNGHHGALSANQMNGSMNALPTSFSSLPYNNAVSQLPGTSAPPPSSSTTAISHDQNPQQQQKQMPPPTAGPMPVGVYNPNIQQQPTHPQMGNMQQQQHHLQSMPSITQFHNGHGTVANPMADALPPDQLQQQLSHHQHQHAEQYAPQQPPPPQQNAYMTSPPAMAMPAGMASPAPPASIAMHNPMHNNPPPNNAVGIIDQYQQLQQHMAAISLAGGVNQPVQNFLIQNDPKHSNMPIYQQQR